jgi:hypothetical protein
LPGRIKRPAGQYQSSSSSEENVPAKRITIAELHRTMMQMQREHHDQIMSELRTMMQMQREHHDQMAELRLEIASLKDESNILRRGGAPGSHHVARVHGGSNFKPRSSAPRSWL